MTTTSAGNGSSAGDGGRDNGENDGDWGWFTPTPFSPQNDSAEDEPEAAQGEDNEDRRAMPGRSGSAIRPVGSAAARTRRAAAPVQQQAQAEQRRPQAQPQYPAHSVPAPGLEAAREHPAPAPQMNRQPQDQAQRRSQQEPQPPQQAQQPPTAETQPRPQSPLFDDALGAELPTSDADESRDAMLIRRTMEEVEPCADAATAYFYALLFVQHPQLRDLFPASMDTQRDRLFRALLTAVRLADDPDVLARFVSGLGRGHRKYGTQPEHYPAVGECLLGALAQYAPNTWSEETEQAWVGAYTMISQTMIDAAAEDELYAPAWWNAQIVSHELRTPQIAVITLRPDKPYPFLAGQYTSVETPWWPRVWRHYSFASSPRSDGLLTFHV
ncbi:MAG TPA: globin domain-containing protein, partial [Streptomyces sp.]|nr:globin domain-containing protein [Streptomyces sp.]